MGSIDVAVVANESVWLDANRFYEAESRYYEASLIESSKKANPGKVSPSVKSPPGSQSSLASEIAHARQKIQNFLKSADSGIDSGACSIINRLEKLEKENESLRKIIDKLSSDLSGVLCKVEVILENVTPAEQSVKKPAVKPDIQNGSSQAADDDDIDLFGSDEEDAEAAKLREERLQAYANKKAKKPALVAKSSVILDVKPWDDETDLQAMEKAVRSIQTDGLVWGASKLVPLAYGIKKLQIVAVVEDEKVSIDWLQETICERIEDMVQSVDVAAFNKL